MSMKAVLGLTSLALLSFSCGSDGNALFDDVGGRGSGASGGASATSGSANGGGSNTSAGAGLGGEAQGGEATVASRLRR